jgi:hypothetical protein
VTRGWSCLWLACALGCASGPQPSSHLARAFDHEGAAAARAHAPDLMAAAERAREQAVEAEGRGDLEAANDHATRARLLLAAAVSEGQRVQLEEARVAQEREARLLEARALEAERAREEAAQETRRELAAQVARAQAGKAFEAAEEAEARRFRRGAEAQARYREAAAFLRDRARLVASAAVALGASAEQGPVREVEGAVATSEAAKDPVQAVIAAEGALHAALRALGAARARREGPTDAEVGSLVQTATEMGLVVERSERGVRLSPPQRTWAPGHVKRLAALLEAHPHGPVRVEGHLGGSGGAATRAAEARAKALAAALGRQGIDAERLQVGVGPASAGAADVAVLWLAYDPSLPPR